MKTLALDKKIDFIKKLFDTYQDNPVNCFVCNKSLTFRKYLNQFSNSRFYCSKKCREKDHFHNKGNSFASNTEKAIYTYLTLSYPNSNRQHNIKDLIPPYEIDFSVDDIYIEYCGSFHFSTKKKGMERKIEKTKLNDKKKRDLICKEIKSTIIRIWAEIGLYSRPELFNKVLKELKKQIDLVKMNSIKGICIEICIDRDEQIHVFENHD